MGGCCSSGTAEEEVTGHISIPMASIPVQRHYPTSLNVQNLQSANRRMNKEIYDLPQALRTPAIQVFVNGEDPYQWKVALQGPTQTCYEEGIFWIEISLSPEYPFKPPKLRFITKIMHPNIDSEGHPCIYQGYDWCPATTIACVIDDISIFLEVPNPDDNPLNLEAASLMKSNRTEYEAMVKKYTQKYAS